MKTPNEVHAFLALKYGRSYVTKLANKLGRTKADISKTINGHQKNEQLRILIAQDSGMTSDEFFEPAFDSILELRRTA